MLFSKAARLRFEKEQATGEKQTFERMNGATGLSTSTLIRFFKREPLDRIDAGTIGAMCEYFGCDLCDLLEYVPDRARAGAAAPEKEAVAA